VQKYEDFSPSIRSRKAGFSRLFNGQPGKNGWHLPAQTGVSGCFLVPECFRNSHAEARSPESEYRACTKAEGAVVNSVSDG
jgi:hypothetical protein